MIQRTLIASFWLLAAGPARAQRPHLAFDVVAPTLAPRYVGEAVFPLLADRATGCEQNSHPCNDINSTTCCPNTHYCMIQPDTRSAGCCPIGSLCKSPCSFDTYQCVTTGTTTASGGEPTATTADACCPRRCPKESQFACPSDIASGCCSYGQTCAAGGKCLYTLPATSAPDAAPQPTGADGACEPSHTACAPDLGGCCPRGRPCTRVPGGQVRCGPPTPTGSGITEVRQGGGDGLSDGAKAGIGIGVAAGAALVIGALTFLCLRRRRRGRRHTVAAAAASRSGAAAVGPDDGGAGPGMEEVGHQYEDVSGVGAGRGHLSGLAYDYTGPDAVAGPYTEEAQAHPHHHHHHQHHHNHQAYPVAGAAAAGPAEIADSEGGGPRHHGYWRSTSGVTGASDHPSPTNNDAAPAEMDSESVLVSSDGGGGSPRGSPSPPLTGGFAPHHQYGNAGTIQGRFELYGDGTNNPYFQQEERPAAAAADPTRLGGSPPVVSPLQISPELEAENPMDRTQQRQKQAHEKEDG